MATAGHNNRLRIARRQRGWTQVDVVERMYKAGAVHRLTVPKGLDANYISRYERGVNEPSPHHVHLLCLAFDMPSDLLGLPGDVVPDGATMTQGGTGTERRSTQVHGRSAADQHEDSSADEDDVRRRTFLRLLTVAATNVALCPVDLVDDYDQRLDDSINSLPALDRAQIERCGRTNASLWAAFGVAQVKSAVLPSVESQIRTLTRSLQRPHNTEEHRELCALAGDVFQLAGEVLFDSNRYSETTQYYAAAIAVSRDADAHDLWACAITRQAFVAIYDREFRVALSLLDAAARVARHGDGSLSTKYWVQAVAAEALAGLGDLAACQRALDRAERVDDLSLPAHNGGWLRFDGSRLAEQRGACFAKLEQPELAEPPLQEALQRDLSTRRRGLVLADLALVALQCHEIDKACSYAEQAIEIARDGPSGVVKRRLLDIHRKLGPFDYSPSVKHFKQHLALL